MRSRQGIEAVQLEKSRSRLRRGQVRHRDARTPRRRGARLIRFTLGHRRGRGATTSIVALLEEHLYPLHATAKAGDVDAMTRILDGGAEVDQAKGDGKTFLFVACEHGHVDLVRLLLDKGAEVDRATENGRRHRHCRRWIMRGGPSPTRRGCCWSAGRRSRRQQQVCEGDRSRGKRSAGIEAENYYPGKISRDCGASTTSPTTTETRRVPRRARLIRKLAHRRWPSRRKGATRPSSRCSRSMEVTTSGAARRRRGDAM